MRVLISSSSGYGHILPMVPLARELQTRGHAVLWATGHDACHLVASAGVQAEAAGLGEADLAAARGNLLAGAVGLRPDQLAGYIFPRMFGGIRPPRMLRDLLPLATQWAPDLLVHEQGELAGPLVAAILGIPSATHSFGGATPAEILAEATGHVAPLWDEHGLAIPPYAGCFQSLYIDICPASVQTVSLAHIPVVQALRPVPYTGEDPYLLPTGDDRDRPLVYLTLGTVNSDAPVLGEALRAVADLGVRVIATVGPRGDPAAFGRQPSHVTVERFVSQTAVLPHCAAVISHAGSGTVLGALTLGLPQVCLPQAADQFRNASGVTRSGAGVTLTPEQADPGSIAAAVRAVLEEDSYRRAAAAIAAEIATMPTTAEVVPRLESVVAAA